MISKVRLQRKFNSKSNFNYTQRIMLIIRLQMTFQLLVILITCLFNLSLDFHFDQIFTCQFWTNSQILHYNLAIIVSCMIFCPYLIYIEQIKVTLVKDCYFTVLVFHSIFGLVSNHIFEFDYAIFVLSIGYLTSTGSHYVAMMLQQKKLIQQINQIESEDRKQIRFQQNQTASLTTFQLGEVH